MVQDHLLDGVRFKMPAPDLHLYSDTSRSGRGAHLLDCVVFGVWSEQEKLLHINLLEMTAMFLALQSFQEEVKGRRVPAMCDNSTVVAYINKQGGTVSRSFCSWLKSNYLKFFSSIKTKLAIKFCKKQFFFFLLKISLALKGLRFPPVNHLALRLNSETGMTLHLVMINRVRVVTLTKDNKAIFPMILP